MYFETAPNLNQTKCGKSLAVIFYGIFKSLGSNGLFVASYFDIFIFSKILAILEILKFFLPSKKEKYCNKILASNPKIEALVYFKSKLISTNNSKLILFLCLFD
jgi:hypothetical protein